jgi:hypothetical protein
MQFTPKYKRYKKKNIVESLDTKLTNEQLITKMFFKLSGLKYMCVKEQERQLLLHKIINWIIYGISPTIGSILLSKKNVDSEILNIIISILLFLVPIFHFILSLQEHDKLAFMLQLYIVKIDHILDMITYHHNNKSPLFFQFIHNQYINISTSTPYISKHTIINYLDTFSVKINEENIPAICKKFSSGYTFASSIDIELGYNYIHAEESTIRTLSEIMEDKTMNNINSINNDNIAINNNIPNNIHNNIINNISNTTQQLTYPDTTDTTNNTTTIQSQIHSQLQHPLQLQYSTTTPRIKTDAREHNKITDRIRELQNM